MLFSRQEYIRNRCVSVARRREGTEFAIGTLYIRGLPPLSPLANTMSGFVENFCGLLTPVFRVHPPRRLPLLLPLPSSPSLPPQYFARAFRSPIGAIRRRRFEFPCTTYCKIPSLDPVKSGYVKSVDHVFRETIRARFQSKGTRASEVSEGYDGLRRPTCAAGKQNLSFPPLSVFLSVATTISYYRINKQIFGPGFFPSLDRI